MSKVRSPLTYSQDVSLLRTISTQQLIRDWRETLAIDISEEVKPHSNVYLYQCNETKLKFFMPLDTIGSGKLYEQLQEKEWYYMPEKWEHRIALKDLYGCEEVLEIGSAHGDFVKQGIDLGINLRGIEINESAVTIARDKGVPVDNLELQKASALYYQSLDAVCSFQVLEHVSDPKNFIQWSVDMLKPGGKLIYCVPNSESFLKYQDNLLDMPPHHMLQWSKKSFKSLEKIFPIKLEKVMYEPLADYHLGAYIGSYSKYFRSNWYLGKLFFNRYTVVLYKIILDLGLNKIVTGQSLYVQFRKC